MKEIRNITQSQVENAVGRLYDFYQRIHHCDPKVWGVPRGGIPVAYLMTRHGAALAATPEAADLIVDDLIDSGRTQERYASYEAVFLAMSDFLIPKKAPNEWLVLPWEVGDRDSSADDIILRLLQYIGEDPSREGLLETPQRVLKAWQEWTSGYTQDPKILLKSFKDGGETYDEMIIERSLPFYSHCEHHLAPFFGTATIAYIPKKKIVGLSKLGRVLEVFSRRLQVQERLTCQIVDCIQDTLECAGAGVLIKARHLCMESRGYNRQGHETITSALRGIFKDNVSVRQEFLAIAQK